MHLCFLVFCLIYKAETNKQKNKVAEKMLQDVIHPPSDQHPIDDVSSPLSAQILELCDPEFLETFQNSEGTSSSNYCYEDHSNSYSNNNLPLNLDLDKFPYNNNSTPTTTTTTHSTTSTTTTAAANTNDDDNNNLSLLFDPQDELDNEISASIDFSSSSTFSIPNFITNQQDDQQFDFFSLEPQLPLADMASTDGLVTQYSVDKTVTAPMMGRPLTSVFEEDFLSSVPSCVLLNPSTPCSSFLGTSMNNFMCGGTLTSTDNSGIFGGGSILLGQDLQPREMEFHGDNGGIFRPDSVPGVFNPSELQGISNENQQFVSGVGNSVTPFSTDISSLEDSNSKVGKLSVEERREKIHKYMKKRNERNFSKKIKYACRKTLADSRPRVRGRFAKNDDFGDTDRATCNNHEENDEYGHMAVKEGEHMVDSDDMFAHISGVGSFNCNYSKWS